MLDVKILTRIWFNARFPHRTTNMRDMTLTTKLLIGWIFPLDKVFQYSVQQIYPIQFIFPEEDWFIVPLCWLFTLTSAVLNVPSIL